LDPKLCKQAYNLKDLELNHSAYGNYSFIVVGRGKYIADFLDVK
jgi:hypothetical protein